MEIELPDGDDLLGRAVRFLLEGGDDEAAAALVQSTLSVVVTHIYEVDPPIRLETGLGVTLVVEASRAAYDLLTADSFGSHEYEEGEKIREALRAVAPVHVEVTSIDARFDQTPAPPGWRMDVEAYVQGREVHNQAPGGASVRMWEHLRFRSESERRIAQALDRAGVLFLPNCRARLTDGNERRTREPDFLICSDGRWGILEVDGEPYHPPTRTVHDHTRDRVFKTHGVVHVEHFDAQECFENPDEVVRKFLALLDHH